jgi:hypothetical protein
MAWNRISRAFWPYELTDLLGQVEIVPAGDGIFDKALATLAHFLFLLFRMRKLHWISDGHGPLKTVFLPIILQLESLRRDLFRRDRD